MEKATPVRKPHASTADMLTWSEAPPVGTPATAARSHQSSDKISKVLFGGQVTDEEAQSLLKRKPCSGYKLKEMTGSGIFAGDAEALESRTANPDHSNRTTIRIRQQAMKGASQISFSAEESVTPKKPTTLAEVAKQRELSGTLERESEAKIKKQISNAKRKELSGQGIFRPPPEIMPRTMARPSVRVSNRDGGQSNILFGEESVTKTARKIHNQKFAELTGNNIFDRDVPPSTANKALSNAKLREMTGSDIFADGRAKSKDYFGGVRRPPGGESSIALA